MVFGLVPWILSIVWFLAPPDPRFIFRKAHAKGELLENSVAGDLASSRSDSCNRKNGGNHEDDEESQFLSKISARN